DVLVRAFDRLWSGRDPHHRRCDRRAPARGRGAAHPSRARLTSFEHGGCVTAGNLGGGSLARSGVAMATGTLASRITRVLRTVGLAAALGRLGDAYNVANTIPNILYDLLLGGVLSSIVIPLLVRAGQDDEHEGTVYAQRLLTIVTAVLSVVAVLGVLLAPQ